MKKRLLSIFAPVLIFVAACPVYGEKYGIQDISAGNDAIGQYELFEAEISVSAPYENPFDPEEIDVSCHFTKPNGETITLPAFYIGKDKPWRVRYTPLEKGKYSYYITLKTRSKAIKSDVRYFDVKTGEGKGFVQKSKNNPYYFVFDSGKPFFGIGHNIAWAPENDISAFERYFASFKENGCNLTRIWITNNPWTLCVEENKLGSYNCLDCDKIDSIIKLAEKYGVYVILVLDNYASLLDKKGPWGEERWDTNPYNKCAGGPCKTPWDFFKDKTAKKFYKKRLRYVVTRWSYSPAVMAFELWNEVDLPKDWAVEMTSYMKSINPHGQLITTSLSYPWDNIFDESTIWNIKDIDFVERHLYGGQSEDITGFLIFSSRRYLKDYKKPLIIGEFGMDAMAHDRKRDPAGKGVALHNSIWASALSGCAGSALNWWWLGYVKTNNLYFHYRALRAFLEGVNWDSKHITPVNATPIKIKIPEGEKILYSDAGIGTVDAWGDKTYEEFTVEPNGDITGNVNRFLYGGLKKEYKITPLFRVDYPQDGKFLIEIGTVSQKSELVVYLDDKIALRQKFSAGPGTGPWKKSNYLKKYKIYQCVYDVTLGIDVPKGRHTVKLENAEGDWLDIQKITLTNYRSNVFANARVTGLIIGGDTLLWIQNKEYNWKNAAKNIEPSAITNAFFSLTDVEKGGYEIEWWDTFEGKILSREKIDTEGNALSISLAPFAKDLACKITKKP